HDVAVILGQVAAAQHVLAQAHALLAGDYPLVAIGPVEIPGYLQRLQGVGFVQADHQAHVAGRIVRLAQRAQQAAEAFRPVVANDDDGGQVDCHIESEPLECLKMYRSMLTGPAPFAARTTPARRSARSPSAPNRSGRWRRRRPAPSRPPRSTAARRRTARRYATPC